MCGECHALPRCSYSAGPSAQRPALASLFVGLCVQVAQCWLDFMQLAVEVAQQASVQLSTQHPRPHISLGGMCTGGRAARPFDLHARSTQAMSAIKHGALTKSPELDKCGAQKPDEEMTRLAWRGAERT